MSSNLDPRHEEFVVTGLTPATWYNLLMSAHNEAGATEAEYVFATLTLTGGILKVLSNFYSILLTFISSCIPSYAIQTADLYLVQILQSQTCQ